LKLKYKKILLIFLLNISIFISVINVNVKAQTEFTLGVNENDEFTWQVTSLDTFKFQQILGGEPNIAVGDQIRMIIRNIDTGTTSFVLTVEFWDYKMDWGQSGRIEDMVIFKSPDAYQDYIFCLTPVDSYLSAVEESSSTGPEYTVTSNSISKVIRAETGRDYIREKVFDRRGVPISETWYEYTTGRVIVRVEGNTTSIPFGIYFLGFIIIALTAIIFITLKRNQLIFKT
jgi:hypothetical protein